MGGKYGSIHDEVGGVDQEGFISIGTLRAIATACDAAEFERRYPAPALLFAALAAPAGPQVMQHVLPAAERERSFKRTHLTATGQGALRYHDQVAFLAKRPNNPFPHMISIGRAQNNDIVLGLDTISKFHGYFIAQGNAWVFTDGRTTAGTSKGGVKLAPGAKCDVGEGDRIRFGAEVEAMFVWPKGLRALLVRA